MDDERERLLAVAREAAPNSTRDEVHIGAAVADDTGTVHTGSIVETRDRHQSIHAERLAIQKAISEGANYVTAIAIATNLPTARVCGSCLQMIYEFSEDGDPTVVTEDGSGTVEEYALTELYPKPWPPRADLFDAE